VCVRRNRDEVGFDGLVLAVSVRDVDLFKVARRKVSTDHEVHC
jgi:hypothetical protein